MIFQADLVHYVVIMLIPTCLEIAEDTKRQVQYSVKVLLIMCLKNIQEMNATIIPA